MTPTTGGWSHLHCCVPDKILHEKGGVLTAEQVEAKKLEEYGMLHRALDAYPEEAIVQAIRVLECDSLERSGKYLDQAKWLLDLARARKRGRLTNFMWQAVATAPEGWAHVRTTMLGTLLDDVIQGYDFEILKDRWDAKMDPLKYQRPTTVKAGNIAEAERIVEKLGLQRSLKRRFAALSDIQKEVQLWGKHDPVLGTGVFAKVQPSHSGVRPVKLPDGKRFRFSEFKDKVLPYAKKIEIRLSGSTLYPMFAMVTAVYPDAPVLFQWTNPFSWYHYNGGSTISQWGLAAGYNEVRCICYSPDFWGPTMVPVSERNVLFILDGAWDTRYTKGGALFPEILRSSYHSIKPTLEAFSKAETLGSVGGHRACGISMSGRSLEVRVDGTIYFVDPD